MTPLISNPAIGIILFLCVAQMTVRFNLTPRTSALLSTIPSYLLLTSISLFMAWMTHRPIIESTFNVSSILILILQILVSFATFAFVRRYDNTIVAWWTVIMTGGIIIFFVLPELLLHIVG